MQSPDRELQGTKSFPQPSEGFWLGQIIKLTKTVCQEKSIQIYFRLSLRDKEPSSRDKDLKKGLSSSIFMSSLLKSGKS